MLIKNNENNNMKSILKNYWLVFVIVVVALLVALIIAVNNYQNNINIGTTNLVGSDTSTSINISQDSGDSVKNISIASSSATITEPISNSLNRITKKTFGLYVTPKNSPISPERFTGYHTGVDFETTPEEQNIDVSIYAVCTGPLLLKKMANGYGGVAVQSCQINQEAVTVVYGHLRLASIASSPNSILSQGQQIGVLGTGFSSETSGERKHLHLGIHKGKVVNILGYVQNKGDLSQWIDYLTLIK
jgi:hypothetical protein